MSDIAGRPVDDSIHFVEEGQPSREKEVSEKWKILVVDDEEEVHNVTRLALDNVTFKAKGLEFLHSYNEKETVDIINKNPDIALILLDVVMETDDSGLRLIKYIRDTLGNNLVRIVIRTGQPGHAPEKKVIVDYDINDYKEKGELTAPRLFSTVIASLRSYDNLIMIEIQREALEVLFKTTSYLFDQKSLAQFSDNVIKCIKDVINNNHYRLEEYFTGFSAVKKGNDFIVHDSISGDERIRNKKIGEILPENIVNIIENALKETKKYYFDTSRYIGILKKVENPAEIIYLLGKKDLKQENQYFINVLGSNILNAYDNLCLNDEIEETQKEIMFVLGEVIEKRSNETGFHVKRVAEYCKLLALKYGISGDEAELIRQASLMHDVGKIGIFDNILNKPGALTADEFELIKSHTIVGHNLLAKSNRKIMKAASIIALQHHEKYNGEGYPQGLRGQDIHIYGRIAGLADVFDAIGSDRIYKKAWDIDHVLEHIKSESGKSFDPDLVDIFFANIDEILRIKDALSDFKF